MTTRTRQHHNLYTIGYSGYTPESFISTLQSRGVRLLIDIRFTPISRKKGFSKTALAEALEGAGIAYTHLRQLGSPRSLRDQLFASKDYAAFFESYKEYLSEQGESISEALTLIEHNQVCLMCVEAKPHECHRNVVADALASQTQDYVIVRHISAPATVNAKTARAARQRVCSAPEGKTVQ